MSPRGAYKPQTTCFPGLLHSFLTCHLPQSTPWKKIQPIGHYHLYSASTHSSPNPTSPVLAFWPQSPHPGAMESFLKPNVTLSSPYLELSKVPHCSWSTPQPSTESCNLALADFCYLASPLELVPTCYVLLEMPGPFCDLKAFTQALPPALLPFAPLTHPSGLSPTSSSREPSLPPRLGQVAPLGPPAPCFFPHSPN